jgi:hypothetical protein
MIAIALHEWIFIVSSSHYTAAFVGPATANKLFHALVAEGGIVHCYFLAGLNVSTSDQVETVKPG